MRVCPICGTKVNNEAMFCSKCGFKLNEVIQNINQNQKGMINLDLHLHQ